MVAAKVPTCITRRVSILQGAVDEQNKKHCQAMSERYNRTVSKKWDRLAEGPKENTSHLQQNKNIGLISTNVKQTTALEQTPLPPTKHPNLQKAKE